MSETKITMKEKLKKLRPDLKLSLKEKLNPHQYLEDLLKYIIDRTQHSENLSKEERLNRATKALWGDREKLFQPKKREKEGHIEFALGDMFTLINTGQAKDIDDAAWKAAEYILKEEEATGVQIRRLKYKLAEQYEKSDLVKQAKQLSEGEDIWRLMEKKLSDYSTETS